MYGQRHHLRHQSVKRAMRLGYRHPVEIPLSNGNLALDAMREITGDDRAVVCLSDSVSGSRTILIWLKDSELATMIKLVAG